MNVQHCIGNRPGIKIARRMGWGGEFPTHVGAGKEPGLCCYMREAGYIHL